MEGWERQSDTIDIDCFNLAYFAGGSVTVRLDIRLNLFGISCFAYLCCIRNRLTCSVKSKPVRQEVSCIVILPLMK